MTDEAQSIAERFADTEVVSPAEGKAATQPQGDPEQPSDSIGSRYAGYDVVASEDVYKNNIADATREAYMNDPQNFKPDNAWDATVDWMGDAGRSTLLGPLARPIGALVLTQMYKDKGYTYSDVMEMIDARNKHSDTGMSSTLTGALLGGALVSSGMKKGGEYLATKSGVVNGLMQWAGANKKVNRIVAAAASGGGAGMIEEGIKSGLEETFDATAGQGFDGQRVIDNVVLGAVVGAAATPALQETVNGGKWFFNLFKKFKNTDVQAFEASKRLMREFARPGEDLDMAANRFREKVQVFTQKNGRVPAAAEIMSPEQVGNVAEVIRLHNGLEGRARELGEEGVERALQAYDDTITRGAKTLVDGKDVPSPEYIEDQMERLFTDVMNRHGKTMVKVDDERMAYMMRNRDWIRNLAQNGNEGAGRMSRILDAEADITSFKKKWQTLTDKQNTMESRDEVAKMKEELAHLLDDAFNDGAEASDIATLRNAIQLKDAIGKSLESGRNAGSASVKMDEFRPQFQAAIRALEDYQQNGLKISLSDANRIRATASRHFNALRHSDPDRADAARRVREAVAPIGKDEVAEYGEVVKRYNLEMTRADAQATGVDASKGNINLLDLTTRLESGRIPGKPKASTPAQRQAVRNGAAEGTRRALQDEVRDTAQDGFQSAKRIAGSKNTPRALEKTLGTAEAKKITKMAENVVDTYDKMKKMIQPKGPSVLEEERKLASDVMTGAVFGNLGGAGKAALLNRALARLQIPRGVAEKTVEMLGNPNEIDKALAFMAKKGIRIGPFFSAVQAGLWEATPND